MFSVVARNTKHQPANLQTNVHLSPKATSEFLKILIKQVVREEPIFGEWKKSYVDEEYISGV